MTRDQQDGLAASRDTNSANNRRKKNVNEIKTGAVRKTRYTPFDLSRTKSTSFTKYNVIQMENELKRILNPFAAYKELTNILQGSPENLTSFGRNKLFNYREEQPAEPPDP